ncbi:AraC family transcriptional regulator [Pseudomonas sp. RIT-PI-S]|uniref:AraC family transcriptional regulator n=1 Tax=Pseudomonas sp. RIT-PI-S TaxID=3035295 RepID=UPI0021D9D902|nr:AraC family transcriptional regulator [Pseudomonas sp. RIT-PI-S]
MADDFESEGGKSRVRVWTMKDLYDAELLKGAYFDHRYPWHSHEELSLGIVLAGGVHLQTRTCEGIAKRGSFVLVNADELHCGRPGADGWLCRTLHIHPSVFRSVAQESFGSGLPVFTSPVIEDPVLTNALLALHRLSEVPCSSLERQSRIVALIVRLLTHHGRRLELPLSGYSESAAVARARAYLDENLGDKVTLDDLAIIAGIPPFRVLRAFRQAWGITPHAYQLQARVRQAHKLLKSGLALAEAATAAGFADQPHLTRVYKTVMGATPGQFKDDRRRPDDSTGLAAHFEPMEQSALLRGYSTDQRPA